MADKCGRKFLCREYIKINVTLGQMIKTGLEIILKESISKLYFGILKTVLIKFLFVSFKCTLLLELPSYLEFSCDTKGLYNTRKKQRNKHNNVSTEVNIP